MVPTAPNCRSDTARSASTPTARSATCPQAVRNYLLRLGWSQGDREFFSMPEMVEAFDLGGIGRSPARFDFAKLENVNGHVMRAASDAELMAALEAAWPFLPNSRRPRRSTR